MSTTDMKTYKYGAASANLNRCWAEDSTEVEGGGEGKEGWIGGTEAPDSKVPMPSENDPGGKNASTFKLLKSDPYGW